jgi:hypothetical protein
MKIQLNKLPFTKRSVLLICFFASMFLFASLPKANRQKIRAFKLKMVEKYFPHEEKVFSEETETKELIKKDISPINAANATSYMQFETVSSSIANVPPDISAQFESIEKQGLIGEFSEEDSDNPSDNFFTVNIPEINNSSAKVFLQYELFGLDSYHSVSRSINRNIAFGGNIIVPSNKWTTQKEQISIHSLQRGKNSILFTSSIGGIKYKVKNVKIIFEKADRSVNAISALLSGNQLYLKGVGSSFDQNSLQINNASVSKISGEFEAVINLNDDDKAKGFVSVSNGSGIQQYKIPQNTTSFKTIADEKFSPVTIELGKDSEFTKNYEGTTIHVEKNSVTESAAIQVLKLRKKDFPAVISEIKNTTPNSYAYRFKRISGVLTKKIKLSI